MSEKLNAKPKKPEQISTNTIESLLIILSLKVNSFFCCELTYRLL